MTDYMRDFVERFACDAGIKFVKHDPNRRSEIVTETLELTRQGYTVCLYVPGPDEADGGEDEKG